MNMMIPIVVFVVDTIFSAWVVFGDGADCMEGTFASGIFFFYHAPEWSALGLRLFTAGAWFFGALWFVAAIFDPTLRPWLFTGMGG